MKKELRQLNAEQRVEVWAHRIASCRNSGMTVRAWCNREGISEKTYYYWQNKLYRMMAEQPTFVEVSSEQCAPASGVMATIQLEKMRVEIHTGADEATISALLRAMQSC